MFNLLTVAILFAIFLYLLVLLYKVYRNALSGMSNDKILGLSVLVSLYATLCLTVNPLVPLIGPSQNIFLFLLIIPGWFLTGLSILVGIFRIYSMIETGITPMPLNHAASLQVPTQSFSTQAPLLIRQRFSTSNEHVIRQLLANES